MNSIDIFRIEPIRICFGATLRQNIPQNVTSCTLFQLPLKITRTFLLIITFSYLPSHIAHKIPKTSSAAQSHPNFLCQLQLHHLTLLRKDLNRIVRIEVIRNILRSNLLTGHSSGGAKDFKDRAQSHVLFQSTTVLKLLH